MIETTLDTDIFRERLRDLYVRYHGFVRRACRRYVQNRDEADDLAQEVILKAARGWGKFEGACEPSTWIYRVAANHCADYLRRSCRQRNLMRAYAAGLERPDPGTGTEDGPARMTRVLADLGANLGAFDRHILYLRFELGLKQEGISRITGVSRVAVCKRLAKIRDRAARLWRLFREEERASARPRAPWKPGRRG